MNLQTWQENFRNRMIKWNVYYIAVYWNPQRSVILIASIDYSQKLVIKECIQKSKCMFQNFVDELKIVINNTKKNLKKDECYYGIMFNSTSLVKKSRHMFNGKTSVTFTCDLEETNDSLELLESIHNTSKLSAPTNFVLNETPTRLCTLLLIKLCESRLFSPPHKNTIFVNTGYLDPECLEVERLPHDKDYRKYMCKSGYRVFRRF